MNVQVDERYYETVKPDSFAERVFVHARKRLYDDFLRLCYPSAQDTILDVGVSDVLGDAANVVERMYPYPERITAAGLGEGWEFKASFPKILYRQIVANQRLPFADSEFDIVISNAVLEHVGSVQSQQAYINELLRVGKRLYVTVPNRYFPVEHHTAIPLLHWADVTFDWACRITGKGKWAQTENLILMSDSRLRRVCPSGVQVKIGTTGLRLGQFSSNLYLAIEKGSR